jgi:uncharacterized protein DUF6951
MKAQATVQAGVCGFETKITAECADSQNVTVDVQTDCPRMTDFAEAVAAHGPVDIFGELSPELPSRILAPEAAFEHGCCCGCIVPAAIFKTMQVAAGLALPADVSIRIEKAD